MIPPAELSDRIVNACDLFPSLRLFCRHEGARTQGSRTFGQAVPDMFPLSLLIADSGFGYIIVGYGCVS